MEKARGKRQIIMIARYKPYFSFEEIKSLLNQHENVIFEFERKFAEAVDSKYAITFPSGRSGLYSIFKALEISKGEVIIPAYTCIVVPPAILASDNVLRYVDISLGDYNMQIEDVQTVISKKTKAVVPTHMYGHFLDVKKLREVVGEDILIIEDAAQAILTKNVGRFGDAAFYSFNFEKQIFTFGGGMVTTNNEEIYEKLVSFKIKNSTEKYSWNEFKKTFFTIGDWLLVILDS